jgi:hypothetical protein
LDRRSFVAAVPGDFRFGPGQLSYRARGDAASGERPDENSVIESKAKRKFWLVVQDCLHLVHGLPQKDALKLSADLRERIESAPPGISSDVFYHAEPFDVANDIVGKQLDQRDYQGAYDKILDKHGW